jgi:hypothetical protein
MIILDFDCDVYVLLRWSLGDAPGTTRLLASDFCGLYLLRATQ